MPSLLCLALSNAIVATSLAVLAVVVARFCRRPAVRHALWLLVLLKFITPSLLPISVTWPGNEDNAPPPVELPPLAVDLPFVPESSDPIASGDEATIASPQHQQGHPLLALRAGQVLIVIWLGGALAWWSVAAVRLRKFWRLLRQAEPAVADVQEQGRRMAALLGLRRCPPIVFVAAPLSPMLWALGLSPRLLVPAELWRKLNSDQQDTLLAHELAHLRRGDHWIRRLELFVLGLYWWHPVVWWTRRRLQEAEEECCDALVVAVLPDAAPAYASALVETVAFLSQTRPAALVGASGAGHVPLLKRRLTMILTETSSRKRSRIGFWIVLGLGALLLPLAPRAAQTQAPEKPQPLALDFGFPVVADGLVPPAIAKNPHMKKAFQMANCVLCHQSPTDHLHDLQPPWKGIHDELVRVMEEYSRELRKSDRSTPSADNRIRAEEIEKLQDEIDLLRLQVRLKEARLRGAMTSLPLAQKRLEWAQRLQKDGTISQEEMMKEEANVITSKANIEVKEVELQEARLLLKQAERRLARFQPPAEKPGSGGRTQQEKRLRELEQKVENLLKEIQKLRKEMQPDKPRDPRLQPDRLKR